MSGNPPAKKCPGRPPKKRRLPNGFKLLPSGSSAAIADTNIPVANVSVPPSDTKGITPPQIAPLTALETLHLQLTLGQSTALAFHARPVTSSNNVRGFLSKIPRDEPTWRPIAMVRTLDLPWWFDVQLNDFHVKRHAFSSLVDILWFGHPIDSPHDPRARQFLVMWKEPNELSEEAKEFAKKDHEVVCRWNLTCAGICGYDLPIVPGSVKSSSAMLEISLNLFQSEDTQAPEDPVKEDIPQEGSFCTEKVQLVLETHASDLNVVHIYQQGCHPDTSRTDKLLPSKRLRNEVMARMRLQAATVSSIMKDIVLNHTYPLQMERPPNTNVSWPQQYPLWRRYTKLQLKNMMKGVHKRGRLHDDPFIAIGILARQNRDKIYYYNPHDRSKPDSMSRFTCAMANRGTLENIILHGSQDGIGIDTSWRNMNENRAGVTFITGVDENGHLVPCSALLSANIKAETLKEYLVQTEIQVIARANEIISDATSILSRDKAEKIEIIALSHDIVRTGHWNIKKVMIDKCLFLLTAILQAIPNVIILICQFHIIQAILRLDVDSGSHDGAPRLSLAFKLRMLIYFRQAQRCRNIEEWPMFREHFFQRLKRLCLTDSAASLTEPELNNGSFDIQDDQEDLIPPEKRISRFNWLKLYFDKNWFCQTWLVHITDINLPPGQTRNGTYATNNWSEAAFLTFNKIFLNLRKNKRIDRLAAIILGEFFPFYEFWPSAEAHIPRQTEDMYFRAYQLWDNNHISSFPERTFRVRDLRDGHPTVYHVDLKIPKCYPCSEWEQTGKWCTHQRASQLFEANGPVMEWTEHELQMQKHLPPTISRSNKALRQIDSEDGTSESGVISLPSIRLASDTTFLRHIEELIPKLQEVELRRNLPGVVGNLPHVAAVPAKNTFLKPGKSNTGFRSGWSHIGGRPAHSRPLFTYRAKASHRIQSVRFSQKRGRKGLVRLSRNSLLKRHMVGNNGRSAAKKKTARKNKSSSYLAGFSNGIRHQGEMKLQAVTRDSASIAGDTGLTSEEQTIFSLDLTRWTDAEYTMRIEEFHLFVEVLKSLCQTIKGAWFFISGASKEDYSVADVLQIESSRLQTTPFGMALLNLKLEDHVQRVFFFNLSGFHWTIWEYDISFAEGVKCTAYNSSLAALRDFYPMKT
ncbi:hypothetical protein M422DRAFT_266859 [Sphaerobolus stellatus SS14]|uniref:Uncharacterized protein n=1 Tax=Sphaerobolus stellatus (strain SS14) TaxID=990650 RepID=A0A0C9V1N7_SPHS4|nr:hypothetical protein M422DRAFT_266859 [Sphaerobolus stellatus SS14]